MPSSREPRDWKDIYLNYDALIDPGPDYTRECQICLTNAQRQALLGIIQTLEWSGGYYSPTEQTIDDDLVDAFADDIAWRLSDMACNDVYTSRIDANGDYQISYDGGVTWTDAPSLDPRLGTPIYAGLSGDDGDTKRCTGANSVVSYFKNIVEEVGVAKDASATFSDLVAVLVGLLLILGIISGGWLFAFLGALTGLIYANYDATAWRAAFTDDIWQLFICIIYDHEQADASFTAADVTAIQADINSQFSDTIARTFLASTCNIGANALTNAARSGFGGVLDCTCGCNLDNWEIDPNGAATEVTRDSTSITISVPAGNQGGLRRKTDKPGCCELLSYEDISGNARYWYYNYCEDGYSFPYQHGPQLFPTGHSMFTVAFDCVGAATVKITFNV